MTIVVRRTGALGDVILVTPVLRRLRQENPDRLIRVETAYPDVFKGNDALAIPPTHCALAPAKLINLDMAYERRPHMHIVDAYMQEAFGDSGDPAQKQQCLTFSRRPIFNSGPKHRYVAVHAAVAGWSNRTLPRTTWVHVVQLLQLEGFWPILVGTERDNIDAQVTRFFTPDLSAQATLIASCACFIGSDSGLLHVAGATATPIVGVFTCAKPEYRLPWRGGALGGGCEGVAPDLDCVGCLARVPPPITVESCERGDLACVGAVKPEAIVAAALRMVEG